ncbi:MAG: LysR family transcriptional regulator [Pseudorhodobacter sp.]|nr:LysR family transcriptional regulator [Pseudorhodobacter sp.]
MSLNTEGSFAAAARAIKVTQPSASKAIADLERRLHHRLLHRTTKLVKPTESVQVYYRRMKELTNLVDEANAEPNATSNRGKLRVNTSATLAQRLVMLAIMGFHYDHPQVEIEVTMDDRRIDLIERATDVVIRVGALASATLRFRWAGVVPFGLFASKVSGPAGCGLAASLTLYRGADGASGAGLMSRPAGKALAKAVCCENRWL